MPSTTPKSCRVTRDQPYGPARRNLLDVYVPADDDDTKKPVLLFMHGGGFFSGDKAWSEKVRIHSFLYDSKCLYEQYWGNIGRYFASQGIIVVIANHQLVYFEDYKNSNPGYSVNEETSARYPGGADDVQLAREWIYENVGTAAYGHGDRNKVVLFGHSSGGAHIAMNLYAQGKSTRKSGSYSTVHIIIAGDPDRSTAANSVHPPVAGVIYLSVPFHFDGTRPIRRKILEKYYGSVEESVWGVSSLSTHNICKTNSIHQPKTPLSLLKNLPEGSPVLDAMTVPHYIGTVKWEV